MSLVLLTVGLAVLVWELTTSPFLLDTLQLPLGVCNSLPLDRQDPGQCYSHLCFFSTSYQNSICRSPVAWTSWQSKHTTGGLLCRSVCGCSSLFWQTHMEFGLMFSAACRLRMPAHTGYMLCWHTPVCYSLALFSSIWAQWHTSTSFVLIFFMFSFCCLVTVVRPHLSGKGTGLGGGGPWVS